MIRDARPSPSVACRPAMAQCLTGSAPARWPVGCAPVRWYSGRSWVVWLAGLALALGLITGPGVAPAAPAGAAPASAAPASAAPAGAAPAGAATAAEENAPQETGPLVLPRAVEDSVLQLVSQGQTLLIRETDPKYTGPALDHPKAWQCFIEALHVLVVALGDRVLEDSRGPQYLTDHGLRANVQRSKQRGFPILVTFYNGMRPDETALYLMDRTPTGVGSVRLPSPDPCCFSGQAVRAWTEGGRDYAIMSLQGVGSAVSRYSLQVLRRDPEGWKPVATYDESRFGRNATVGLDSPTSEFPRLDVIQIQVSNLFSNPPTQTNVLLRSRYEVHADSLHTRSRGLDPSSFGPSSWVMEALARGHKEWALPYARSAAALDSIAALPWDKASSGWRLESFGARFDTMTVSHPAVGRLRVFGGQRDRRWAYFGYEVDTSTPPAPERRHTPPSKKRSGPAGEAERKPGKTGP
ncbi:MAG: hypothetical protein HZB25_02795 [Candidatus Eisenbacteria bacterium]|nr:hypothetical protein [Candidatus Eisenbacteria bacterium]